MDRNPIDSLDTANSNQPPEFKKTINEKQIDFLEMLQNKRRIVELITGKKFADVNSPNTSENNAESDDEYYQINYREFDTWEKTLQEFTAELPSNPSNPQVFYNRCENCGVKCSSNDLLISDMALNKQSLCYFCREYLHEMIRLTPSQYFKIVLSLKKKNDEIKKLKCMINLLERKIQENLEKLTNVCCIKDPVKNQSRTCQIIMENDKKVRNVNFEHLKTMR